MYQRELEVAVEAAKLGGREVMAFYETGAKVSWKAGQEPVTEADLAANEVILNSLSDGFPNDGILSEELKDDLVRRQNSRVWVVDPLDGTREFVDRVGQFVIMIGLAVEGEPVVGAVYHPITGRCWMASKGGGAFIESASGERRPIRVSQRKPEDGIRLVLTRSHLFEGVEEIKKRLGVVELKQLGSVGLKVGAITEDEADLYVHISEHTKEWDSCAPHAILEEAGGVLTDLGGNPITYNREVVANKGGLLATNGLIHEHCLEVVRPLGVAAGLAI